MRKSLMKVIRFARCAGIVLVVSTMNCGCSTTHGEGEALARENVEIVGGGRTRVSFVKMRENNGVLIVTGVVSPRGSRTSGGHGHVDIEMLDSRGVEIAERSVTYSPHYLSRRESARFTTQFDRRLPEDGKLVVRHQFGVHFPTRGDDDASTLMQ